MEGAAAAMGSTGRAAVATALLVAFDAALRFGVARILSEPATDPETDAISLAIVPLLPPEGAGAAPALAGAWRGALAAVAEGWTAESARDGLDWALGDV
jgi:hypothetical protein